MSGFSDLGLTRQKSRCQQPGLLSVGSEGEEDGWRELVSELIQVGGRIHFFMVVGLKFPFPCWLSAENLSQQLNASCLPCHVAPSNRAWSFLQSYLTSLLLLSFELFE